MILTCLACDTSSRLVDLAIFPSFYIQQHSLNIAKHNPIPVWQYQMIRKKDSHEESFMSLSAYYLMPNEYYQTLRKCSLHKL
jgi:hypothetical protein